MNPQGYKTQFGETMNFVANPDGTFKRVGTQGNGTTTDYGGKYTTAQAGGEAGTIVGATDLNDNPIGLKATGGLVNPQTYAAEANAATAQQTALKNSIANQNSIDQYTGNSPYYPSQGTQPNPYSTNGYNGANIVGSSSNQSGSSPYGSSISSTPNFNPYSNPIPYQTSAANSQNATTSQPSQTISQFSLSGGNLQNGSSGDSVKQLQSLLGITSDGKFGPNTLAAVKAFQQKNGIPADGIVGPQTAALLSQMGGNSGNPTTGTTNTSSNVGAQTNAVQNSQTQNTQSNAGATAMGDYTASSADDYERQIQSLSQISPAEAQAKNELNTLQANSTQGQFNVSQQPIAQSFVSGQQAAMQTQANIAQQPLQARLALAQAQRQTSLDAAQSGLTYALGQNIALPYGAQYINRSTGDTLNGGIYGGATAGGSGINPSTGLSPNASTPQILGYLAQNGIDANRYDLPGLLGAIGNGATAQDIITGRANVAGAKSASTSGNSYKMDAYGNFIQPASSGQTGSLQGTMTGGSGTLSTPKANAASLSKQQEYADTTQRAFNTANDNLGSLLSYMSVAGVNNGSTVPLVNSLQNKVKAGVTDAGTIAGFRSALAGLRSEYAQVLSRGGEVTDSARASATSLLPDNLTPAQLKQVADRLNIEGSNAIKEANAQVQVIKDRASGKTSSTQSSGTASKYGITY